MDSTGVALEECLPVISMMEAHSSPPASDLTLPSSDPVHERSITPPSSPPPYVSSPLPQQQKTSYSRLKRKRSTLTEDVSTSEPLIEISTNQANKKPPAKKGRQLTQMQIDLGGEVRKTCKGCGMDYIPSNTEDAALHKEYHKMNIGGVDMGKAFVKEMAILGTTDYGGYLAVVDGRSPTAIRNKIGKVLEAVNKELGAIEIDDSTLWGRMDISGVKKTVVPRGKKKAKVALQEEKEDRYKAFLYIIGDKCVGFCLTERIHNASRVLPSTATSPSEPIPTTSAAGRSSSISTSTERDAALLGISRIWTSKSHRRKGISSALLESARSNFFYGIEIPKEMVAFSQPSESGGQLAENWYGEKAGWHVYTEVEKAMR